jgi:hypothetical protein
MLCPVRPTGSRTSSRAVRIPLLDVERAGRTLVTRRIHVIPRVILTARIETLGSQWRLLLLQWARAAGRLTDAIAFARGKRKRGVSGSQLLRLTLQAAFISHMVGAQ